MANAVVGSVPPTEVGIASGTNSALREIGGVFGIAILATVFAHTGVYASPSTFIDHFKNAVWLGAAFSAVGIIAAVAIPGRTARLGTDVDAHATPGAVASEVTA
ncbi:hypothetical protein [Nocardia nepalensis]|uniref:hypothetical protein n=1 Tax=Nocardia nepalensis TaxID=3375448 RepID=UPI003B67FB62